MPLSECITFFLWISDSPSIAKPQTFFNVNKFSYRLAFHFWICTTRFVCQSEKCIKIPSMYYVLTIKSVISSKILIRNNRVFSCLDSSLALYRLIGKKSLSLTFTSKIRILTRRYIFIFYFIFYLFIYLFIYLFFCIVHSGLCLLQKNKPSSPF